MALRISRVGHLRGRPPDLAGGISGAKISHSGSERSLGYRQRDEDIRELQKPSVLLIEPHYPPSRTASSTTGTTGTTTSTPPSIPPPENTSPEPEPQDVDKGPLAGGTAIGKDVLVPGDVNDILPDGTTVVGIDQIIIETQNCQLTEQGNNLTITMSDRGVPFRIRDSDNADITLEQDGTIVANGRSTLVQSFPEAVRENPDKLIVPIPVDPENDVFPRGPNDTFPIISSTGISGDGCRVVGDSIDGGSANT